MKMVVYNVSELGRMTWRSLDVESRLPWLSLFVTGFAIRVTNLPYSRRGYPYLLELIISTVFQICVDEIQSCVIWTSPYRRNSMPFAFRYACWMPKEPYFFVWIPLMRFLSSLIKSTDETWSCSTINRSWPFYSRPASNDAQSAQISIRYSMPTARTFSPFYRVASAWK